MAARLRRPLLAAVAAGWLATLSEGLAPRPCSLRVHEFIEEALAGGRPTHSLGSAACVLDSDTGFTPLHEAANRGGIRAGALVEAFMDAFAWVREVDNQGATALHIAAQSGQTVAAAALCGAAEKEGELPSLLNQMDENGASALDLAEANDHVGVARILVRRGGRRGSAPPEVQCSAELLDAMLLNDAALAASLLSSDAQKAQTCLAPPIALGRTLLHHAVAVSTFLGPPEGLDVIRTLLSYGANSSLPDAAGETPLAVAAGGDRGDVVMVLLESPEVKIDAQDGLGRTALHQASRAGAQRSSTALLIGGANPHIPDSYGMTPVAYAERAGFREVQQAIQSADALVKRDEETTAQPTASSGSGGGGVVATFVGGSVLGSVAGEGGDDGLSLGIVLLTLFLVGGSLLLMACAYCIWQMSSESPSSQAVVNQFPPKAAPYAKPKGDKAKLFDSEPKLASLDVFGGSRKKPPLPPGQIEDQDEGDSSPIDGEHLYTPKASRGSRRSRARIGHDSGCSDAPIVVIAPQRTPTTGTSPSNRYGDRTGSFSPSGRLSGDSRKGSRKRVSPGAAARSARGRKGSSDGSDHDVTPVAKPAAKAAGRAASKAAATPSRNLSRELSYSTPAPTASAAELAEARTGEMTSRLRHFDVTMAAAVERAEERTGEASSQLRAAASAETRISASPDGSPRPGAGGPGRHRLGSGPREDPQAAITACLPPSLAGSLPTGFPAPPPVPARLPQVPALAPQRHSPTARRAEGDAPSPPPLPTRLPQRLQQPQPQPPSPSAQRPGGKPPAETSII